MPHLCNSIQASVRGFLLGDKHPEKRVKYHKTWWDGFKDAYFPKWLKRRFPVKWVYETFSFSTLYPDFKPSLPPETSEYFIHCSHYKKND